MGRVCHKQGYLVYLISNCYVGQPFWGLSQCTAVFVGASIVFVGAIAVFE